MLTRRSTTAGASERASCISRAHLWCLRVAHMLELRERHKYPSEGYFGTGGAQVAAHHSAKDVSVSELARRRRRSFEASSRTQGWSRVC